MAGCTPGDGGASTNPSPACRAASTNVNTHLKAGSLPTTQRPSKMGTLATLTSEKPEAPSARLKVPVCVVCGQWRQSSGCGIEPGK